MNGNANPTNIFLRLSAPRTGRKAAAGNPRRGATARRYSASQPRSVATASRRIESGSVAIRVRWLPPGCTKAFMLRLPGVAAHAAEGNHGSSPP